MKEKFNSKTFKAWHEVCIYVTKDNTMSANTGSYFAFQITTIDNPSPKPKPEWPPVEPTPIPPATEPPSTVPPVTGLFFKGYSFMLN